MVQSRPSLGPLVTAGLTLRLAGFGSARLCLVHTFQPPPCTSVLLLVMLHHQSGMTGTTYWLSPWWNPDPLKRDLTRIQVSIFFFFFFEHFSRFVWGCPSQGPDESWQTARVSGRDQRFFSRPTIRKRRHAGLSLWRPLMPSICPPRGTSPRSVSGAAGMDGLFLYVWLQPRENGTGAFYLL